jgi:tetratricopeptide (TPR) repeat protein
MPSLGGGARACRREAALSPWAWRARIARDAVRLCLLPPAVAAVLAALSGPLPAQGETCPEGLVPVAQVVSEQGSATLERVAAAGSVAARLNAHLCPDTVLETQSHSRVALRLLESETVLRVDQDTRVSVRGGTGSTEMVIELFEGAIHFLSRVPRALEIRTPYVNAGVKGTELVLRVSPIAGVPAAAQLRRAYMTLFEGAVGLDNPAGALRLEALGEPASAMAPADGKPQPYHPVIISGGREIQVQARDTVQWTLYYPPAFSGPQDAASSQLREAARLVAVGRVDEALPILDEARTNPPQSADALALLAVILVSQADNVEAEALARGAVAKSPGAVAPAVALSYALQAQARLEQARDALIPVAEAHPDSALVWSRLAELHLAMGYRNRALAAAEQATAAAGSVASTPEERARTRTILGFAALSGFDRDRAEAAFLEAIALDSASPLPRMGLGLVRINRGDLVGGRREIETAAVLNPRSALIRSYLGKAYFEEDRDAAAVGQFEMAMGLDPADPTPWLYDAILQLTDNRPVDALHLLRGSIARNDNRAVYRSRLFLDKDLAVRGAAIARVFDDLDFDQRAIVESTKSLSFDPSDHSAHRFLADSYAEIPRHEIAHASELLQSQLLQPINIDPVQPQMSQTDLRIVAGAGPADISLNELNPLFQEDGVRFDISGFGGNNETLGDEAVITGLYDQVSISAGQFHYESDGFRRNNDLEHDIYSAFGQVALSDEVDVQFEYRRRRTEHGDLRLNFDPDDFFANERRSVDEDVLRGGFHYEPAPHSDVIGSFIYSDRSEVVTDDLDGVGLTLDQSDDAYDGQLRYIFSSSTVNFTAGFGIADVDASLLTAFDFTDVAGEPCPDFIGICETVDDVSVRQHNAYAYADLKLDSDLVLTFGLSHDNYESGPVEVDRFNPKLGLQWDVSDNVRLRLAYFKAVKRALVVDQTLEPTTVAGFNQLYDDINGTKSEGYGAAVDVVFTDELYGGVEAFVRDLTVPSIVAGDGTVMTEDQHEELYRGYLYWAPDPDWAFAMEAKYERLERDDPGPPFFSGLPTSIDTLSVPVEVSYFHPSGFFARAGATFVYQQVGLPIDSTFDQDEDQFVVVDAAVGYRLPDRRGLFEIEANNLLDEHFLYQDNNIQAREASNPIYLPELTVLARLTLSF